MAREFFQTHKTNLTDLLQNKCFCSKPVNIRQKLISYTVIYLYKQYKNTFHVIF